MVRLCGDGDKRLAESFLHNCAGTDPVALMEHEVGEYARKSELDIQYYRIWESTMPLVKRRFKKKLRLEKPRPALPAGQGFFLRGYFFQPLRNTLPARNKGRMASLPQPSL